MNIQNHTIDKTASEDGVWLDFDGAEFLIASSRGKAFQRAITRKSRKFNQAELKRKPELFLEITNETLAETVLLDWRGVKNGDADFPCTPANKALMLSLPEFRDWLSEASAELENFRVEAIASDAAALKSGA